MRVRVRVSGTASTSLSTPDFYGTTMHGRATTTQYSQGEGEGEGFGSSIHEGEGEGEGFGNSIHKSLHP